MASNERKRQKKLEKKRTNRKKTLQTIKKMDASSNLAVSNSKQILLVAKAPIYQCLVPASLFQTGIGNLIISRKMGGGYIGMGVFLVDVYCLGIKDAYFRVSTEWEYQSNIRHLSEQQDFQSVEAAYLRKLIEEAETYAQSLGFAPHKDYQLVRKIFGDIDQSSCHTQFVFGKDGKPFYFAGPYDSEQKSKKIIDTLMKHCGLGGFHYMVALGSEDAFGEKADFDEEHFIACEPDIDTKIPITDFLAGRDLNNYGELESVLEDLISSLENGYFLCWEAVMRQEQGLVLNPRQQQAIEELISFNDESDDPILYIDEIARPNKPWYEIVREVVPHLVAEPFKTSEIYYGIILEGWPNLAQCLTQHAQGLSLPQAIISPIDVVPLEIQHKLWLQYCFDALQGLGQDEELTLANPEQQDRVEMLVERLVEHIDSVEFFNLSLEKLLKMVIMPKKDEEVFVKLICETLKMSSIKESLVQYIKLIK